MNWSKLLEVFTFFKKDLKKGGFSTIIAMILIVLVSVGAISVMWLGLYSMINVDISNFDSKLSIVTEGGFTFYDAEDKSVTIQIESTGDDTPAYVQIILIMGDGEELISVHDAPEVNSRKRYYLDVSGYDSYPVSVSIAPIFYVEGQNVLGQKISPVNFPKRVEVSKFYENAGVALIPSFNYVTGGGRSNLNKYATDSSIKNCFDLSVDPVPICTCEDLQRINEDLGANYELRNNIDCSDTVEWNSGEGFIPIGGGECSVSSSEGAFLGDFDGNGYKIYNLFIQSDNLFSLGLFACSAGTISNVGMENVRVLSELNSDLSIGGLTGVNRGSIEESYVSYEFILGYFQGKTISAGGLVGTNAGVLSNCYSKGKVNIFEGEMGLSSITGLLIGGGIIVLPSIANFTSVGGLVGFFMNGSINHSYAVSEFVDNSEGNLVGFGGLIGGSLSTTEFPIPKIIVEKSFSDVNLENVGHTMGQGGMLGYLFLGSMLYFNYALDIDDFYWNNVSSDSPNNGYFALFLQPIPYFGYRDDNCTAIDNSASYFYDSDNAPMNFWDFDDIWREKAHNYPMLRVFEK